MTRDDLDVERLRALVAAEPPPTAHPASDLLARAAAGEASEDERASVADHLATCATCSEEYRVAAALGPWAQRAADDLGSGGTKARAADHGYRTWALAASALLAAGVVTALAVWGLSLRSENLRLATELRNSAPPAAATPSPSVTAQETRAAEVADLQARLDTALAPALNTPIVDLLPRDGVRGSGSQAMPRVPAGAQAVTFVIATATDPASRDHGLEIVAPSGEVRWRGSGLRPNAERSFTVTVPRILLPPGTCRLRLFTERNGARTTIAEYAVRVEP